MYKHLYNIFSKWYRGGNIYLYSDPHFNDNEMKQIRKNYISDEEQIKRINSKVGKNDTIIFLGDIGDVSYIKKIKGYKILIKGNHDKGITNYQRVVKTILDSNIVEDNKLFDEVYEGPLVISEKIILSHEPINLPFLLNIHGHDHSNLICIPNGINVCAENINYTPVNLKDIINSGRLKKINSIHKSTHSSVD